jgi:hypothetical protein
MKKHGMIFNKLLIDFYDFFYNLLKKNVLNYV